MPSYPIDSECRTPFEQARLAIETILDRRMSDESIGQASHQLRTFASLVEMNAKAYKIGTGETEEKDMNSEAGTGGTGKATEMIASRVRALRTSQEMTIDSLSAKSGVSKGFISDFENGKRGISIDTLEKLANGLGVLLTFDSLVGQKPDPATRASQVLPSGLTVLEYASLEVLVPIVITALEKEGRVPVGVAKGAVSIAREMIEATELKECGTEEESR